MRALTRPLAACALAVTALLTAAPAQAAAPSPDSQQCLVPDCDPFWLFRPCGPIVKCP